MKLPHWLLRLLPMWDYICPRCRREVSKNAHKCPHCGERFPFPLRVPPKCLKDPEALEAYVHEKIFPKISLQQREYLAQYFTILFQDGFESGDFSAWTGTVGSPSIATSPVYHGSYAAKFDTASLEFIYKYPLTSGDTKHLRFYVYFENLPTSGNKIRIGLIGTNTAPNDYVGVEVINDAGTCKWQLMVGAGGTAYFTPFATPNPTTGVWYCVEIKCYGSGSSITRQLWIDGTSLGTDSRASTATNFQDIHVGAWEKSEALTNYIDCVVAADTYIGPELILKQWSQTLNMAHVLSRPYRIMQLTHALQTLHAWTVSLPEIMLKQWTAVLQLTHVFNRPVRVIKLPAVLQPTSRFSRPHRFIRLLQQLGLVHEFYVSKPSVRKTKLFLVLGGLAIQLSND